MSRFSPFRTLCSLVTLFILEWILLALVFAFLPSYPSSWEHQTINASETQTLITRVYKVRDFFPYWDSSPAIQEVRNYHRDNFAIDWNIRHWPSRAVSRLVIDYDHTIVLTDYSRRRKELSPSTSDTSLPWVSETITIPAKLGDLDGINLPWFRQADATILFWNIHNETASIPIRLQVYDDKIEVVPDVGTWDVDSQVWTSTREPLIVLSNTDGFNSTPVLVEFPKAWHLENSSPSRGFSIRRASQSVLVPTGLFIYRHSAFVALQFNAALKLVVQLLILYAAVVFICWIANGKPHFGPWSRSFLLTRHAVACMPTLNRDTSVRQADTDGENGSARRPQPLRGIGDFFRSASPLDDLFVTFEYTKSMVEPLRPRRGVNTADAVDSNLDLPEVRSKNAQPDSSSQSDVEKGGIKHQYGEETK